MRRDIISEELSFGHDNNSTITDQYFGESTTFHLPDSGVTHFQLTTGN